jgi:hypothetical protein
MDMDINQKITHLNEKYELNKLRKQELAFNLFTLSTYGSQLENFHSDILQGLLNPKAFHGENDLFLSLFISFLNNIKPQLNIKDFQTANAIVEREAGRIDISIKDNTSKKAIIIENKINDAVDQVRQIDNYYEKLLKAEYEVVAIVYLTLDGVKNVPPTENQVEHLILNIPAFSEEENDLIGLLNRFYSEVKTVDTAAFVNQYIKLIKHLNSNAIDKNLMNQFYKLSSSNPNFDFQANAPELNRRISTFRADKLVKSILTYSPFKKYTRYLDDYRCFENLSVQNFNLKLDLSCNLNGSAAINFWIPNAEPVGRAVLTELLSKGDLLKDFGNEIGNGGNGYIKKFTVERSGSMEQVDIEISNYVKLFLERLAQVLNPT